MRILLFFLFSPLILLLRALGFLRRRDMAYLPEGHPEMAKAVEKARRALPEFRQLLAAPEPGMKNFAIKVRFPVPGGGSEHIWVGDLEPRGSGFTGQLSNHPEDLHGLAFGSTVDVTEDMISDWAYSKDGVYYGHFTTKILLPKMSKKMRRKVTTVYGWAPAAA